MTQRRALLALLTLGSGLISPPLVIADGTLRPIAPTLPSYTEAGRRARIQGEVSVDLTIATQGQVLQAQATSKLPMGLTEAALKALRTWTFPVGIEAERHVSIAVRFELEPENAWEDGGELVSSNTVRVWAVFPETRLEYGLRRGYELAMDAPDALDAAEAVVRRCMNDWPKNTYLVSVGGQPASLDFIRRFAGLRTPVRPWRPAREGPGFFHVDLRKVTQSPLGDLIVTDERGGLYRVDRAGETMVVTADYRSRGCLTTYKEYPRRE